MADTVPKAAGERRRRNVDPSARRLSAGDGRVAPALPMADPHPRTVAWWSAVWSSPMSLVWLESDEHELFALADLKDLQHRGEATAAVLAEIRQVGDRFGLSPLARRRLQWDVDHAAAKDAPVDDAAEDGSRWLRVVSD